MFTRDLIYGTIPSGKVDQKFKFETSMERLVDLLNCK